jgi:tRNA-Thr(GGU) m(6)t(6)A37 methyltransferase TsaA
MPIAFTPIGVIRTPFRDLEGMPVQPCAATAAEGRVIVEAAYVEGLRDLDGFSHIILLYHFHRATGYRLTVTPFLDTVERGLFATRAPRRPNPIGLSIVGLERIEGPTLTVHGVDMLDGTPLLDIKPWVPAFDMRSNARSGWLEEKQASADTTTSDRRFIDDA